MLYYHSESDKISVRGEALTLTAVRRGTFCYNLFLRRNFSVFWSLFDHSSINVILLPKSVRELRVIVGKIKQNFMSGRTYFFTLAPLHLRPGLKFPRSVFIQFHDR